MNTFKTTACIMSMATVAFAMEMPGGGDDGDENFNSNKITRSAPSTPVKASRPRAAVTTPERTQPDPNLTTPPRRQPRVQQAAPERRNGVHNVRAFPLPGPLVLTGEQPRSILDQVDAHGAANPLRTYTAEEQARLRFNPDGSSYLEPELPTVGTSVDVANFSNEMTKLLNAYKSFSLSLISKVFSPKAADLLKSMNAKNSHVSVNLVTPDAAIPAELLCNASESKGKRTSLLSKS